MPEKNNDVKDLVFEQLLHADLRSIVDKGCLDGFNFRNAGILNGSFFVQVQASILYMLVP